MSPWMTGAVGGAAFAAGAVNAAAGGGSLLTFPVLVGAGFTPVTANVSNAVGLCAGYVTGALGYRDLLRHRAALIRRLAFPCLLGSLFGCVLLLAAPARVFAVCVPCLVSASCVLLLLQPRIRLWLNRRDAGRRSPNLRSVTGLCAVYGAYFGGGLGILLIAALGVTLDEDMQELNALKGLLSLLINLLAAAVFVTVGPVDVQAALVVAAGSVLGGAVGAAGARRVPAKALRLGVVTVGLAFVTVQTWRLVAH